MKITIVDKQPDEEDEILVKCSTLDDSIVKLLNSFKSGKGKLVFYKDEKIVLFEPKDIFYFESVDDHVFAYTKDAVYESKEKLYQLEQELRTAECADGRAGGCTRRMGGDARL